MQHVKVSQQKSKSKSRELFSSFWQEQKNFACQASFFSSNFRLKARSGTLILVRKRNKLSLLVKHWRSWCSDRCITNKSTFQAASERHLWSICLIWQFLIYVLGDTINWQNLCSSQVYRLPKNWYATLMYSMRSHLSLMADKSSSWRQRAVICLSSDQLSNCLPFSLAKTVKHWRVSIIRRIGAAQKAFQTYSTSSITLVYPRSRCVSIISP